MRAVFILCVALRLFFATASATNRSSASGPCLPNALEERRYISVLGGDGLSYDVPLRIARPSAYWDSLSIFGEMVGILVEERLGIAVEYQHCEDEMHCMLAVLNCADWQDYQCTPILSAQQAIDRAAEGRKFNADPIPDIMLMMETVPWAVEAESYVGTGVAWGNVHITSLGPSGFVSSEVHI
eukprot:5133125-Amphidinium_carterae.1